MSCDLSGKIQTTSPALTTGDLPGCVPFGLESLDITAGEDVAFAYALLRRDTAEGLARNPQNRLRLSIGLRRDGGRWVVTHEHHSFPDTDRGVSSRGVGAHHRCAPTL